MFDAERDGGLGSWVNTSLQLGHQTENDVLTAGP